MPLCVGPLLLLIIVDRSRRGFAQFELIADFLQARSKRFNLLLLVRDLCLELLLLLSDGRFLLRRSRLQVLNCAMLFKELVEQHRVDRLVAHRVNLAFGIASHEIGVHFFHFLGYEAKLRDALGIKLLVYSGR
jgi:hypothetical protein